MKKLITIILAVVLALMLGGCKKVEPTNVTYKYSVKVQGTVYFDDNGSRGNPASNIEVTIGATNSPKAEYHAITGSDGKFSMLIPCSTNNDNKITFSVVKSKRGDGKQYSSKSAKTQTLSPGATGEEVAIELAAGVNLD